MLENVYLTIIIVIILMLSDYFLTLKGFSLYKKNYSKHIKTESYELNPPFKESVSKSRYNFKHLLSLILISLFIYFVHFLAVKNILGFSMGTFFLIQGMIFSIFVYINSRHIQNLVIFNALNKNSSMLSGRIKQTYLFSLASSSAHAWGTFLVFVFIFMLIPSMFTFGFTLGPLALILKNRKWIKEYSKNKHFKK